MRAKAQRWLSNAGYMCMCFCCCFCCRDTPVEGQQAAKTEVKQNKMPHSKHHEYTANKQDISYTAIKTTKSTQKQRKPKAKQSSVMLSEEQLNYAEMTFHRTPQLLSPKREVRKKRQGTVVYPFYK